VKDSLLKLKALLNILLFAELLDVVADVGVLVK